VALRKSSFLFESVPGCYAHKSLVFSNNGNYSSYLVASPTRPLLRDRMLLDPIAL